MHMLQLQLPLPNRIITTTTIVASTSQGALFIGQRPRATSPSLISLSTWRHTVWMLGRDSTDGFSIHLTNWWRVSGYGGLGPGGHFTTPLIAARCKLPPCSPREYSKGDIPYLKPKPTTLFRSSGLHWTVYYSNSNLSLSRHSQYLETN